MLHGRWTGGGWEVDGTEVDGRWMGWKVGRWMGYECGECGEGHCSRYTVEDAHRKSKNLPSRGIPGRFLSLVLISLNIA